MVISQFYHEENDPQNESHKNWTAFTLMCNQLKNASQNRKPISHGPIHLHVTAKKETKLVQYWFLVNWKNKRKRTASATHRFKYFALFKNVAHSSEPGSRLQTMYNVLKYHKKWLN